MTYTVLARRYRSQSFDEVVGQSSIATTLQNAVKSGRVAHAYLFTGTRGVGKTSTARIFAKALAGGSKEADEAIMRGQDTDVIEIDAASNTGVDQARELIANSSYRPLRGKKKVYIIDEVHMLSNAAFNALLKTMEEPPEHVVFILCTTESHKVPATIQSRCQRFDFRNIPSAEIAAHLKAVLKEENSKADDDLIHVVARLGNGSMRDALSLMDRLLASGEKKLTVDLLQKLLGLPDRDLISALIDAAADGDAKSALEKSDELTKRGISGDQLLDALTERFRELMILAACGPDTELVELSGPTRQEEVRRAARFDAAGLVHMIALCHSTQYAIKNTSTPRALLDALVVRLAQSEKLAEVTALVAKLGANGAAPAQASPRPKR